MMLQLIAATIDLAFGGVAAKAHLAAPAVVAIIVGGVPSSDVFSSRRLWRR